MGQDSGSDEFSDTLNGQTRQLTALQEGITAALQAQHRVGRKLADLHAEFERFHRDLADEATASSNADG